MFTLLFDIEIFMYIHWETWTLMTSAKISPGLTPLVAFRTPYHSPTVVGKANAPSFGAPRCAKLLLASAPGEVQETTRSTDT